MVSRQACILLEECSTQLGYGEDSVMYNRRQPLLVASPNQLLTVNFQLASTVLAVEIPFLKEIVFCYSEEFRYHLMLKKAL